MSNDFSTNQLWSCAFWFLDLWVLVLELKVLVLVYWTDLSLDNSLSTNSSECVVLLMAYYSLQYTHGLIPSHLSIWTPFCDMFRKAMLRKHRAKTSSRIDKWRFVGLGVHTCVCLIAVHAGKTTGPRNWNGTTLYNEICWQNCILLVIDISKIQTYLLTT